MKVPNYSRQKMTRKINYLRHIVKIRYLFAKIEFTTPSTSHQTPCIPNNRFPHQEYHP